MSKFGSLVARVDQPHKENIISPLTGAVLKDKDGNPAYVEVYSSDSKLGREFDLEQRSARQRQLRVGDFEPTDDLATNQRKCAALTKSWYLVDPVTLDGIDEACTHDNALALYSDEGAGWLFVQVWVASNRTANFMQRPSNGSAVTASQSGETAAG
jgi:hypothetical protein